VDILDGLDEKYKDRIEFVQIKDYMGIRSCFGYCFCADTRYSSRFKYDCECWTAFSHIAWFGWSKRRA
ncbi:MAG: hypothetical protein AABY22_20800, partial [Nanoarchaeota archaeon]